MVGIVFKKVVGTTFKKVAGTVFKKSSKIVKYWYISDNLKIKSKWSM